MKTAVVLFNLGGPDSLKAVRPFLFNMFSDKAILGVMQPFRYMLAKFISISRTKKSQGIYAQIGGKSPLAELTQQQADALEKELSQKGEYRVFVAMRYWKPTIEQVVAEVKAYDPEKVILLPLYPQFSTTTTQTFFDAWYAEADKQKLQAKHHPVCCYPFDNHFIDAHVELLKKVYNEASAHGSPRILFSAHGLPQKIIDKGDPYQWQIERTVSAIMRKFGPADHIISYQSRVGPIEWIKPYTDTEIERAGKDDVPIIIVPVAFVSENSETLVELDIDYKILALKCGVKHYTRVPALGVHKLYIESLAWLCDATTFYPNCSNSLGRQCPKEYGKCGFREWKTA
jgi:ferrochelatase